MMIPNRFVGPRRIACVLAGRGIFDARRMNRRKKQQYKLGQIHNTVIQSNYHCNTDPVISSWTYIPTIEAKENE